MIVLLPAARSRACVSEANFVGVIDSFSRGKSSAFKAFPVDEAACLAMSRTVPLLQTLAPAAPAGTDWSKDGKYAK